MQEQLQEEELKSQFIAAERKKARKRTEREARGGHSANTIKSCQDSKTPLISSFTDMPLVDRYFMVFHELHNELNPIWLVLLD